MIKLNMLSQADKVAGQGVGSAYIEQVKLIKEMLSDKIEVSINGKEKYDIEHHHTLNFNHYLRLGSKDTVHVTYVHFLPHTLDGSIKLPKVIFDVFKKYVIRYYTKSDYLIVVNPIFMDELASYGIPKDKIKYIPNYVSKETFYAQEINHINKVKADYKIPLDKKIVLGVGQVQSRKGVLDFVEIAKKLPQYQFIWCGGFSFGKITDGYKELKEVVEEPPHNVKFLGIVDREHMNDIYNLADVLFMPSYNELFPMAILEAVNIHKPLVLRDLDLYRDILFSKYLGADDNESFQSIIESLFNNQDQYDEYCQYSKEISEFYSKENIALQWDKFYHSILHK